MRITGQAEANRHLDMGYYWSQRVRVHIPVITYPGVRFQCGDGEVFMGPGECWLFDTWRLHNVLNPNPGSRIHLVVDTVGSSEFWEVADTSERPFSPRQQVSAPVFIDYKPDAIPALVFEAVNFPVVMSPWEADCQLGSLLADLQGTGAFEHSVAKELQLTLIRFLRRWRALWARFGVDPQRFDSYRSTLEQLATELGPLKGRLILPNGLDICDGVYSHVFRPALGNNTQRD